MVAVEGAGPGSLRVVWLGMLCVLVCCGQAGRGERPVTGPGPGSGPVELPRLVHLEPGAEVGQGPPAHWTHRVVRSVPRLASGDLADLPGSAAATATRFRTVIAADVVGSGPSGSRLARIGVGNAVPVGARELVVTPSGPPEALETLDVVERVVLIAAEKTLGLGAIVARTPTFALFRSPTILVVESEHRESDLCYALLVDPQTGSLATACWTIPTGSASPPSELVLLAPDLTFDAPLDARATRRIGPLVVSWSFALASLPPGVRIPVPDAVAPSLALPGAPINPAAIERALRSLLGLRSSRAPGFPANSPDSRN